MRTSTVVFCISAHGLGHLSQVAPVINRLGDQRPDIAVTIRSGLTRDQLAARVQMPFAHQPVASDFGFVMKNAIDIDMEATLERYVRLHSEWPRRVRDEAHALIETGADLVISNVAYLPLGGGRCSRNSILGILFAQLGRSVPALLRTSCPGATGSRPHGGCL